MRSHEPGRDRDVVALRIRDGLAIARCAVADRPLPRLRGLLGRRHLPAGEGLVLSPCRAVHTLGMRFAVDVLFLDGDGCVLRVAERLVPGRVAGCRGARSVVELPAGQAQIDGVVAGDRVVLLAPAADGLLRRESDARGTH